MDGLNYAERFLTRRRHASVNIYDDKAIIADMSSRMRDATEVGAEGGFGKVRAPRDPPPRRAAGRFGVSSPRQTSLHLFGSLGRSAWPRALYLFVALYLVGGGRRCRSVLLGTNEAQCRRHKRTRAALGAVACC